MSQSFVKNYLHIVFSTKNRENLIRKEDLADVFSYISGIIKNNECSSICVGGITNHIHLLCALNKNLSVAQFVAIVKANSSKWLHKKGYFYRSFAWQEGYAAFSVSQSQVERVRLYIQNQEHHHQRFDTREELKALLDAYQIEYKACYL